MNPVRRMRVPIPTECENITHSTLNMGVKRFMASVNCFKIQKSHFNNMNRTRDYYRKMRAKHIRRTKIIGLKTYHWKWEYAHDGMYAKGKVHCSCPMCSPKTRNKGSRRYKAGNYDKALNYKHSDMQDIISMDQQIKDFLEIL